MAKNLEQPKRLEQIRRSAAFLWEKNRTAYVWIALGFVGPVLVGLLVGSLVDHLLYATFLGVLAGLTLAMFLFGQLVQKAAYANIEGQAGAAAAVLEGLRGDWMVTPAVAVNKDQDVVHRAVGRAGVVLVAEGSSPRVARLLAAEKKKVSRVAFDTPIYDLRCGDGSEEIPLNKLQSRIMKLPRNLTKGEVAEVRRRMRALGTSSLPMPKGPLPKSARAKMPKMPRAPR
ncbi:MAG: DUF4191 domain-containing protein [Streptosporangiales bacterium]|nr:DUF4191 domain-containing protein [Streptosporangiales bacterium]MBO0890196.1 DUF4191 domain-containing protein [Acidothermales bacterium]